METSFKTGFAQISFAAQKNLSCPKFGGAAAPPAPPARTPMTHKLIMKMYTGETEKKNATTKEQIPVGRSNH